MGRQSRFQGYKRRWRTWQTGLPYLQGIRQRTADRWHEQPPRRAPLLSEVIAASDFLSYEWIRLMERRKGQEAIALMRRVLKWREEALMWRQCRGGSPYGIKVSAEARFWAGITTATPGAWPGTGMHLYKLKL
jgi:hypothetical protein